MCVCVYVRVSLSFGNHILFLSLFIFRLDFSTSLKVVSERKKRKKDEEIVLLLLLLLSGLFVSIHLLCDVVRFLLVEASKVWPLVGLTLQQEHLIKGRARLTPPPL